MGAGVSTPRLGRHTTAEERREYIARFEKSGLPARVFCEQQGLLEHTFYIWRSKARNQGQPVPVVPVHFTEVSASPDSASPLVPAGTVSLHFPEGWWLEAAAGTDVRWLGELVQALRVPAER